MATRIPPALNLAVLCSYVEFDGNGRPFRLVEPLYSLGVLPDARGKLPAPTLDLHVHFEDENARGTFWFMVEVRTASGFVIPGGRTARTELSFTGDPDPLLPYEHVFHLRDLVFPEPGRYHFHVMCNHMSLNNQPSAPLPARLRVIPAERSTQG